jgi:TonB-dependent starch-binding outer membrane protein SusC
MRYNPKKLSALVLSFLLSATLAVHAQTPIKGRIVNKKDGTPLAGATIEVKGTKVSAVADFNGDYNLIVPKGADRLIITYSGYQRTEVAVGQAATVAMSPDDAAMTEVVVTGYKTSQKRNFTGSAGVIKGDAIAEMPIASFDQALQGRTPGLLLRATSGQPGNSGSAIIRGRGSIEGSPEPIYIVDGIQIAAADFAQINPNDIENVSVLKDAVGASLYGSRGGNGVIVVSTKRGRSGKPAFEIDAYTGWSRFPDFNDMRLMTTAEKVDYELRRGGTTMETYSPRELDSIRGINTNWLDELTQTGRTYSVNASASGGSEKTRYFASVNYFNQEGSVVNTGFDRVTGRLNLSQDAGNFSFGINTTGTVSQYSNTSEQNTGIGTPLNAGIWANPYEQPFVPGSYNAAGNFVAGGNSLTRPRIAESFQPIPTTDLFWNTNSSNDLRIIASGNAEYRMPFLKGLSAKIVYGIDYRQFNTTAFVDRRTYSGGFNPRPTSGSFANHRTSSFARDFRRSQRVTNTNSLNYANSFGDHSFDAGVYYETVDATTESSGRSVFLLESPFQNEAGATINADLLPRIRTAGANALLKSYFSILSYSFKNRYFINANVRRDASSRFGSNNRWSTFGGIGAAWVISDENFMAGSRNYLSNLKFKISYGTVGNQEGIGEYQWRGVVGNRTYNAAQGTSVITIPNPNLQWESRKKFNTGFEFGFFNNRLNGGIEYYNETTADLFLPFELSRTTGGNTIPDNVGSVRNSGLEISLNYDIIRNKDMRLTINGNFTYNKNEVLRLANRDTIVSSIVARIVGKPINSIFLVEYAGVNPDNGNAQYRTLDGKLTETYNPNDRTIVGNADPVYFGGFGFDFNVKGFFINTQFTYMGGLSIYNNERNNVENPDYYYDNLNADLLNEWQKPGDITNIPRPDNPYVSGTTRFVENNSFVRLRQLNLGYNIPVSIVSKIGMRSLMIYGGGTNLLTWTKFRGFDPEFPGSSQTGAQYPALRTVQVGVRVGF